VTQVTDPIAASARNWYQMTHPDTLREHELALQRAVTVWIATGLAFMLLPGTFLGVWNLIGISGQQSAAEIDPAWLQAHGHAQMFGWIGTFILGIGFYSLSKMAGAGRIAVRHAWLSWALWTAGVALRWATNLWHWEWRLMLPLSAVLELAGFIRFFLTVSGHKAEGPPSKMAMWMRLVIAGSIAFLLALIANLGVTIANSLSGASPAIPHERNQALLALILWGFPVLSIWGFSARWLPVFLGLKAPEDRQLKAALALNAAAIVAAAGGWWLAGTTLFLLGAGAAAAGLHVFSPPENPPKINGVHSTFPAFVRIAYGWVLVSAVIGVAAALWDHAGGLWGASRHALTVGFISTMVFAIGQRVLPAFCGMRVLFSPRLMFAALAPLSAGCALRVISEICAYEGYAPSLWPLLPLSAVIEMTAFTLFAANLALTLLQPPAHLKHAKHATA